jgi:hypothetical protein
MSQIKKTRSTIRQFEKIQNEKRSSSLDETINLPIQSTNSTDQQHQTNRVQESDSDSDSDSSVQLREDYDPDSLSHLDETLKESRKCRAMQIDLQYRKMARLLLPSRRRTMTAQQFRIHREQFNEQFRNNSLIPQNEVLCTKVLLASIFQYFDYNELIICQQVDKFWCNTTHHIVAWEDNKRETPISSAHTDAVQTQNSLKYQQTIINSTSCLLKSIIDVDLCNIEIDNNFILPLRVRKLHISNCTNINLLNIFNYAVEQLEKDCIVKSLYIQGYFSTLDVTHVEKLALLPKLTNCRLEDVGNYHITNAKKPI